MEQKRGALLTIWLWFMLIGAASATLYDWLMPATAMQAYPQVPSWAIYVEGAFGVLIIIFVIYLFKWKKWAFSAYSGLALVSFLFSIAIGMGFVIPLFTFVGPIILYLILRPKWNLLT